MHTHITTASFSVASCILLFVVWGGGESTYMVLGVKGTYVSLISRVSLGNRTVCFHCTAAGY